MSVCKYNLNKSFSTLITFGTPIVTLLLQGDMFVHKPESCISAAGMLTIFFVLLFAKDKLAEWFKAPSALILSSVLLVLIIMIEHILLPMKNVCIATIIVSSIDELTFKKFYKRLEKLFPDAAEDFKHIGFYFTSTEKLKEA
jgi:hypothetical protein